MPAAILKRRCVPMPVLERRRVPIPILYGRDAAVHVIAVCDWCWRRAWRASTVGASAGRALTVGLLALFIFHHRLQARRALLEDPRYRLRIDATCLQDALVRFDSATKARSCI